MIAGVEHQRAEHAADRLSEAATRILSQGGRIRKAAAPGWSSSQRVRSEAVNEKDSEGGGYLDEYHHKQSVVSTAALRHWHDLNPRLIRLAPHAPTPDLHPHPPHRIHHTTHP